MYQLTSKFTPQPMKHRLLLSFISLSILFLSCSKSKTSAPNNALSSVTFDANGVSYSMPAANIIHQQNGERWLTASDASSEISVKVGAQAVTKGTFASLCEGLFNSLEYDGNNGSFTITITSVHDGLADGTFSGTTSQFQNASNILTITKGVFMNIVILQ